MYVYIHISYYSILLLLLFMSHNEILFLTDRRTNRYGHMITERGDMTDDTKRPINPENSYLVPINYLIYLFNSTENYMKQKRNEIFDRI